MMTNDAVVCEKCGGELEIGFVWDRCLKCGHLQNRDFETYRPKCDRCGCYLTNDNRVNDLCKACDDYLEQSQAKPSRKHAHYYKDVSKLNAVDVYMVCKLFGVNDAAISHAVKKLLCSGQRGYKDAKKDIQEAIDTLQRYIEIESELGGDNE
jgi:hypothetical protein